MKFYLFVVLFLLIPTIALSQTGTGYSGNTTGQLYTPAQSSGSGSGDVTGAGTVLDDEVLTSNGTSGDILQGGGCTMTDGYLDCPPEEFVGGEFCLSASTDSGGDEWCLKIADSGINPGTCTKTGDVWSGDCPVGDIASVAGFVQPSVDGEGLRIKNSAGDVVAEIDPDTGSYSCLAGTPGTGCTITTTPPLDEGEASCLYEGSNDGSDGWCIKMSDDGIDPGDCVRVDGEWTGDCPVVQTYSAIGVNLAGANVATGGILTLATLSSTFGSHVNLNTTDNEIELLTAGTYKISTKVNAGFTVSTTECMMFAVYDKTGAALIAGQQNAYSGSGDRSTTSGMQGVGSDGVAIVTIASPIDIDVRTGTCPSSAYPATNLILQSSVWVERVL